jgi:hypothetical protein
MTGQKVRDLLLICFFFTYLHFIVILCYHQNITDTLVTIVNILFE